MSGDLIDAEVAIVEKAGTEPWGWGRLTAPNRAVVVRGG